MLLSVLVLAATLDPSAQATDAVKSAELPASHSGVSQAALDAGFAAFKKRRFAEAEVDFRKAMEADPASAGPYFYLGYTYYKLAEKQAALPSRQGEGEGDVRQGLRDRPDLPAGLGTKPGPRSSARPVPSFRKSRRRRDPGILEARAQCPWLRQELQRSC